MHNGAIRDRNQLLLQVSYTGPMSSKIKPGFFALSLEVLGHDVMAASDGGQRLINRDPPNIHYDSNSQPYLTITRPKVGICVCIGCCWGPGRSTRRFATSMA